MFSFIILFFDMQKEQHTQFQHSTIHLGGSCCMVKRVKMSPPMTPAKHSFLGSPLNRSLKTEQKIKYLNHIGLFSIKPKETKKKFFQPKSPALYQK